MFQQFGNEIFEDQMPELKINFCLEKIKNIRYCCQRDKKKKKTLEEKKKAFKIIAD